jgi:hypothetical protein
MSYIPYRSDVRMFLRIVYGNKLAQQGQTRGWSKSVACSSAATFHGQGQSRT